MQTSASDYAGEFKVLLTRTICVKSLRWAAVTKLFTRGGNPLMNNSILRDIGRDKFGHMSASSYDRFTYASTSDPTIFKS
ncbi:hypothetical protein HanXRQr2_Chr04g0150191 [Helianthus annuus]|uniref:Uncharacterized protein n=1 Tax=Helianthus annuus TaxID=4232 RepID=A0A251UXV7_HELAN|nr:hypothetical protein HanXRQr2_Chr04g0150191 [Helianthus annuus]KAJ0875303.1 hypothetical protein HanPSC8_Chr11g0474641 [Helianthus annuus]